MVSRQKPKATFNDNERQQQAKGERGGKEKYVYAHSTIAEMQILGRNITEDVKPIKQKKERARAKRQF
jgi:hypothetical protein